MDQKVRNVLALIAILTLLGTLFGFPAIQKSISLKVFNTRSCAELARQIVGGEHIFIPLDGQLTLKANFAPDLYLHISAVSVSEGKPDNADISFTGSSPLPWGGGNIFPWYFKWQADNAGIYIEYNTAEKTSAGIGWKCMK